MKILNNHDLYWLGLSCGIGGWLQEHIFLQAGEAGDVPAPALCTVKAWQGLTKHDNRTLQQYCMAVIFTFPTYHSLVLAGTNCPVSASPLRKELVLLVKKHDKPQLQNAILSLSCRALNHRSCWQEDGIGKNSADPTNWPDRGIQCHCYAG